MQGHLTMAQLFGINGSEENYPFEYIWEAPHSHTAMWGQYRVIQISQTSSRDDIEPQGKVY